MSCDETIFWYLSNHDLISPFSYVPPPPSRPRYNDFEYTNSIEDPKQQRRLDTFHPPPRPVQSNSYPSQVIGQPLYYTPQSPYYHQQQPTYNVPSLAVHYIPNVGWRYFAVVPTAPGTVAAEKLQQLNTNQLTTNYNDDANKYHGNKYDNRYNRDGQYGNKYDKYEHERYQAKLRKYKAYELLKQQKLVPQNSVSNHRI